MCWEAVPVELGGGGGRNWYDEYDIMVSGTSDKGIYVNFHTYQTYSVITACYTTEHSINHTDSLFSALFGFTER